MSRRGVIAIAASCVLIGCGVVPTATPTTARAAPRECRFPEGTELAFIGAGSIAQLGIDGPRRTQHLVGMVYVTADPVKRTDLRASAAEPPQRWYCIVYSGGGPGGDVGAGPVPDDWVAPGARHGDSPQEALFDLANRLRTLA